MITDQIGWHEVLLPITKNYNKISYILFFFLIKTQEILRNFLVAVKKAIYAHVWERWCILSDYLGMMRNDLLVLKSGQLIASQIWEFSYSYD